MQTGTPPPDLLYLALILSGRLADFTLNVYFQLLSKWEALATLSPSPPVESVSWRRVRLPHVDQTSSLQLLQFLVLSEVLHVA